MKLFFYIVLGLVGLLGLIALIWRYTSLRLSLPCPTQLSWMVEMDNPILRNNSARQIVQHLALRPGMKVLDFGCGPGRLTIPVAKQVGPAGEVTAFDLQPGMLERVRTRAQAENLGNIQFVQGAAGEGKLGQDQFDRALLVTVLGEIPDRTAAMRDIFDSLKPGGILSVTEAISDPHFLRRDSVTGAASSVGFVEKDFFGNRIAYTIHFQKP